MRNRYFYKFESRILKFFYHFNSDNTAKMFKLYFFKYLFSNKPKIAINVTNFNSKKEFYTKVVNIANHYSVPWVMSFYFIPLNDIYIPVNFVNKSSNFRNIILRIPICIKYKIEPCGFK